jgi:hypothetical protein
VVAKYWKWLFFGTLQNKNPLMIKAKICKTDIFGGICKLAKVHNDRRGIAAPHLGEVVDWWSFFSSVLFGKHTANPER